MSGKNVELERRGILRILAEVDKPIGANRISELLLSYGINLKPRTVRFHLSQFDKLGLTRLVGRRDGRILTDRGMKLLGDTAVVRRKIFAVLMDEMIHRVTYSTLTRTGNVCLDFVQANSRDLQRIIVCIEQFFNRKILYGKYINMATDNSLFASVKCPTKKILFAVINSMTIAGIFLRAGIHITPRFAGLLEVSNNKPSKFCEKISYDSCSTCCPFELFIKSCKINIKSLLERNKGIILADFWDFPSVVYAQVRSLASEIKNMYHSDFFSIGKPDMPFLEVVLPPGRTGLVMPSGLNLAALLYEYGVEFEILTGIENVAVLATYNEIVMRGRRRLEYVE